MYIKPPASVLTREVDNNFCSVSLAVNDLEYVFLSDQAVKPQRLNVITFLQIQLHLGKCNYISKITTKPQRGQIYYIPM